MKAEDVLISPTPWICGMRSEGWGGPVTSEVIAEPKQEHEAFERLIQGMCEKAAQMGFNAIIGAEFWVDPWHPKGCRMSGQGSLAILAPIFGAHGGL